MQLIHAEFIEHLLASPLKQKGTLYVGCNLNQFLPFEKAEQYANKIKSGVDDRAQKGSKDSILGRLVEEIVVYLLAKSFEDNKLEYIVTNRKDEYGSIRDIFQKLKLVHSLSSLEKKFDADIAVFNPKRNDHIYILSVKGTTRERIGQFLSHLFMMDSRVMNAKYSHDRYVIEFERAGIKLKYGFVTMDWAKTKDFARYNHNHQQRRSVKEMEVQLINDDQKLGGGIFVLNNLDNFEGVGNFGSLVGKITDFLR